MKKLKRIYSNEDFVVAFPTLYPTIGYSLIKEALTKNGIEFIEKYAYFHVTCNLETGGQLYKLLKSLDI